MLTTLKKMFKYVFNKDYRTIIHANLNRYDGMDDEKYLKLVFKANLGYPLNLEDPRTFNEISEGVIAAKRHIHMTTADAAEMGLADKQVVSVKIPSANGRELIFGDVVVRVSDKFALAMHIDTDESNAAAPTGKGIIIK